MCFVQVAVASGFLVLALVLRAGAIIYIGLGLGLCYI